MRRTRASVAARILLAIGLTTAIAAVQAQTFTSTLSGPAENPPTASTATGTTTVILNTGAHTLRVISNFSGLTSGTTASHIHCCAVPPANAGVATQTPTFANFPLGVQAGSMDQTLNLQSAASYNPAFITANGGTVAGAEAALVAGILAGQAYLNIHTTQFPGGEIRGFLLVASGGFPIPTLTQGLLGILALMLAGATVLVWRRRMR